MDVSSRYLPPCFTGLAVLVIILLSVLRGRTKPMRVVAAAVVVVVRGRRVRAEEIVVSAGWPVYHT